jgi:hypothetical protein
VVEFFEFFCIRSILPECLAAGNLDAAAVGTDEVAQEFEPYAAGGAFLGSVALHEGPPQGAKGRPEDFESPIHPFGNGDARIGDGDNQPLLVGIKLAAHEDTEAGIGVSVRIDEHFPEDLLELQGEVVGQVRKPFAGKMQIEVVVETLPIRLSHFERVETLITSHAR